MRWLRNWIRRIVRDVILGMARDGSLVVEVRHVHEPEPRRCVACGGSGRRGQPTEDPLFRTLTVGPSFGEGEKERRRRYFLAQGICLACGGAGVVRR